MTESLQKEYVQEEFKKMKTKNENKTCADCLGKNPTWASIPYGILICMECASLHRSFGVHLTFVRSTLLDTWTAKQMKMMHLGGNENARNFFRQHGFEDQIDGGKLLQKYSSKAAELYRNKLKRQVEGGEEEQQKKSSYLKDQFQEKPTEEKKKPPQQQKQQQNDDFEDGDSSDEYVTQKVSEKKNSSTGNNSPQINVSKYSSNQKKTTTGISDKKKANVNFDAWDEWDDFDKESDDDSDEKSSKNKKNTKGGNKKSNKKETVIPTRDNPKTYSHSLAYDDEDDQPEKKQEYQSPYQSKRDTYSSNNNKNNSSNSNEKSRYQRQPTTTNTTSQKSNSSSNSKYESKTTSYDTSSNAQDRFKNAKSISSDQYFGTDKDITPQRQTKLNQFSSAKSISSSEYFGEEEDQSDFGSNIVETAKSDLNKLTSSLMTGGKKLAEMTKDFFNDFQDRYN